MRLALRTRLSAAALLLPLVAFATATGGEWLRCRMTGAVMEGCCAADEAPPPPAVPTVSEADCCDRVVRTVTPAVAELVGPPVLAPQPPAASLASAADVVVATAPPIRIEVRRALAPPTAQQRLVTLSTLLI